ncbi:MAG: HDIG domain-containing protein, partial [Sphaerochaeta sp.]|nr:HDIG domain-containing protein [Sphaerochaeta sp.]
MKAKSKRQEARKQGTLNQQLAIALMCIAALAAMLTTLYSGKGSILGLYDPSNLFHVGELADEDFYATKGFEFIDVAEGQRLAAEREREVLPIFTYQIRSTVQSKQLVGDFIESFGDDSTAALLAEHGRVDDLHLVRQINLLASDDRLLFFAILRESADFVLEHGLFFDEQVEAVVGEGYGRLSYIDPTTGEEERPIESLVTTENLALQLESWFSGYGEQVNRRIPASLTCDVLALLLSENVSYDRVKTMSLRGEARSAVVAPTMTIERGTKIISRDTVVTQSQLQMLSYMQEHAVGYSILELIGRSIFILITTVASVAVFLRVVDKESRIYLYLNLMLVSIIISLAAMHLISSYLQNRSMLVLDSFLPLFFAPLFVAHISSKRRLGFITAFLLACYATLMREATLMTFFFILSVNAINLHFFRYSIKRVEDLFNWFYAAASASLAALAFSPLNAVAIHSLPALIGALVVNITLSLIIVEAFVPVVEHLFNIPTAYRLNELAYSDSPIIDRLSSVAQGTYNHSRYVSELAYQAAKAIGANAMLARVGGVYHDIGKVDHPEYFVENQGGENKHDDIKPSLSVAIIKSHVKLGLEKGREAGLPQEVLDIISQHHGNDIIQYFYSEAARQAQASGVEINADDYSYTGEPPTFAESAIVMLADIVEAASRTMKQPSYSKYQKLVHTLVMGKIERGQLNQSGLSLTDLNRIEESFVQTLT